MKTLRELKTRARRDVYLVDTDVVSELRKHAKANHGVAAFFKSASARDESLYLSAITVGELRRGVELIRYRGDFRQAETLERWLESLLSVYAESVLPVDGDVAQVWARLRVPHPENPLDNLIAATALLYGARRRHRQRQTLSRDGSEGPRPVRPVAAATNASVA